MRHYTSLFFYFTVKSIKETKYLYSSLAGISLGIAFLIRPYSSLAISIPIIFYFLYLSVVNRERELISFVTFLISLVPALVILVLYNYYQTGSLFLIPFEQYNPYDKLGFGLRSRDIIVQPIPFTFITGIKNTFINLANLNWHGILFLFIFLSIVLMNKKGKWDILLLSTAFVLILFHLFYHGLSSRYYHPAFFALTLLAAKGISLAEISFKKYFPGRAIKNSSLFLLIFIILVNIFIVISPIRVIHRFDIYKTYRDPFDLVKERRLTNSVVFLKSVPEKYNNATFYIQNSLDFSGHVLFAKDLRERNVELIKYYPKKEFYEYEYDRLKKLGKLSRLY